MNLNEWERYLDEKSNCYYWYSNKTGETYWDEENKEIELLDYDNNKEEEEKEEEEERKNDNIEEIRSPCNPYAFDYSDEEEEDQSDDDEEKVINNNYSDDDDENDNEIEEQNRKRKEEENNYSDEDDENNDDDDENDQLISNLINKDILYRTQKDITYFTYCFIIHAIVIETPLCIIESILRSLIFFILTVFYFTLFVLSFPLSLYLRQVNKNSNNSNNLSLQNMTSNFTLPPLLYITVFLLLESIVSFSLGLSFFIPGLILMIYRDFNGIDDWKLHPIPSIIGWIDPRRLASITLGQGSSAINSSVQWKLVSSSNNKILSSMYLSDKRIEVMDTIKFDISQKSTLFHQPFCFPRDILSFLRSNH